MLDIGIMFRMISDDMMDIMVFLPPSNTETTDGICDDDADCSVYDGVVSYSHVSCIMGCEDKLMPH
jgi:hypothetical protein